MIEQLRQMLTKYKEALRGIYTEDSDADPGGDVLEDVDYDVLEELLADAYAGINGHAMGVSRMQDTVRQWLQDNYIEQDFFQDNGTEQPTGPPSGQKENTAENGGERYSFLGYAEDGKGIYKSNFPKGTPKRAKGERILRYIQDVWSKKPITLRIEKNGQVRYIEAKFDPTYDETENVPTDASKLMGGNRHGNSAEQRVTLDLADDYYQLASESHYNYSKQETGKNLETHDDVRWWHYFVNDIYFAEYDSDDLVPYTVTINVKEKTGGEYVYSFSAERTAKKEGHPTQRTLHAVVNSGNESAANGISSMDSIRNQIENVKQQIQTVLDKVSPNHGAQMERYTELKDSDPEAAQGYYDSLMNGPYQEQFEEYLKLTEELERLEGDSSASSGSAQEGGTADGFVERASVDDSVEETAPRSAAQARNDGETGNEEVKGIISRQVIDSLFEQAYAQGVEPRGIDLHLRFAQIIVWLRQAFASGAHPRRI